MQHLTNSTAASMSMAFSSPKRANAATAQKENRVSTSPHLSPENIGHIVLRAVASEGAAQFSADQLTLSRPGGTHYPHPVLLAPRIFRPCDGPVTYNM